MDELQLVRELFSEQPPPDPDVASAAKARLARGSRGRPSARRVPRLLVRAGIPAVAAAAVGATIITTVVVPGPASRPPTAGGSPRPASGPARPKQAGGLAVFQLPPGAAIPASAGPARQILLTAARTVAKQAQPAPERYYVTSGIVGNFLRVGPPGNHYVVLEVVDSQYWAARSPKAGSPQLSQALYVQLASPADQAAWRADGSPTTWNVGQDGELASPTGMASGWLHPLSVAAGPLTPMNALYGAQQFLVGDQSLTLAELQALPADPARLKQLLLAGWSPAFGGGDATSFLFQTVPAVLEMPVTPAVRSALYQVLASMPGVQSLGAVTDIAGEQGVAVAYTQKYSDCGFEVQLKGRTWAPTPTFSSCSVQQVLVIGPGDGMPLAEELRYTQLPPGQTWSAPDGLFSYELFGTPYWTNQNRPH